MRKLAISNRALAKLKRLELNDRERAADAIAQLQNGKDLTVRMLASEAAPELWAFQSGELRIVFRQLGGKIIVLGVFNHAPGLSAPKGTSPRRPAPARASAKGRPGR
jgi:mRNA-degrading endonuclease RelE of RelBE toxin-antitoxin system